MKIIFPFLVIILWISCQNSTTESTAVFESFQEPTPSLLTKHPLTTWMRKSPAEIGCLLESELSYKDSVFNCSYEEYINNGDPCDSTVEYYEGVHIPDSLFSKIHSSIKDIRLEFEHGSLRELEITFKDSILITDVKNLFDLPDTIPENVMEIHYGDNIGSKDKPINPNYTRWLTIYGFEHMGAGDVDCE